MILWNWPGVVIICWMAACHIASTLFSDGAVAGGEGVWTGVGVVNPLVNRGVGVVLLALERICDDIIGGDLIESGNTSETGVKPSEWDMVSEMEGEDIDPSGVSMVAC